MADSEAKTPPGAARSSRSRTENAQFTMLNRLRREHTRVDVYLVTGTRLQGRIQSFDGRSLLLQTEGGVLLLYHHAVSSVQPSESRPRGRPRGAPSGERSQRGPGSGRFPAPLARDRADEPMGAAPQPRKAPAPVVVTRRRSRISGPPRE